MTLSTGSGNLSFNFVGGPKNIASFMTFSGKKGNPFFFQVPEAATCLYPELTQEEELQENMNKLVSRCQTSLSQHAYCVSIVPQATKAAGRCWVH